MDNFVGIKFTLKIVHIFSYSLMLIISPPTKDPEKINLITI